MSPDVALRPCQPCRTGARKLAHGAAVLGGFPGAGVVQHGASGLWCFNMEEISLDAARAPGVDDAVR